MTAATIGVSVGLGDALPLAKSSPLRRFASYWQRRSRLPPTSHFGSLSAIRMVSFVTRSGMNHWTVGVFDRFPGSLRTIHEFPEDSRLSGS